MAAMDFGGASTTHRPPITWVEAGCRDGVLLPTGTHTQLLQYDPIADSSLLASGLGFDHLVPGYSTILGESPSLTLPPPLLSSCQSPGCVPVIVERTPAFCQASLLSAAAVPQGLD